MNKKKALIILAAIVVLGFGLRAYKLGEPVFVTDEFLDINATYGYFQTGEWKAWDFNLGRISDNLYAPRDERAWIYRWQVAQLFRFFPPTEAVARSVSVFWGVISIVIIYLVGTYFTKKREIGLIAAFLFAVSMLGISIDRTFRMYAMFFPVYLLLSWFLYRFFEEEYDGKSILIKKINKSTGLNLIWLLPTLIVGIASFMIQDLAANIGVVFFSYSFIMAVGLFWKKRSFLNKYTASLLLSFLAIVALFVFFPEKASWYFHAAVKFFKLESRYLRVIGFDYINLLATYVLLLFGTYAIFSKSKDKKKFLWIGCSFFVILSSAFLFWNYVFGERLIFFIFSFGIILIASGIYRLSEFLSENSIRFKRQIFVGSVAFILVILPNYSFLFGSGNMYKADDEGSDYRKKFEYITENGKAGDVLLTRNFRSYYYTGAGFRVLDIGNGKRLTGDQLKSLMFESNKIWALFGDGKGSLTKDALEIVNKEFKIVKKDNGENDIYLWEK